jgi:hypothetical protein
VADRRDVAGVDLSDLDSLVAAYWQHHQLATSSDRADRLRASGLGWAEAEVRDRIEAGDDDSFRLLVALAEAAPTDDDVGAVGAGPIEDLIEERWSDEVVVDRLVGWAHRSNRFASALGAVWYSDAVPASVVERLRAVAK